MTSMEFAKKLMNRVNSDKENYHETIHTLFYIFSEKEKSDKHKGFYPICTYADFCDMLGFTVAIGNLKTFIHETKKELEVLISEELKKEPETCMEAMIKVIYFHHFIPEFEGVYKYYYNLYLTSGYNEPVALYIAEMFAKIRGEKE